jgi:hypothetical protein
MEAQFIKKYIFSIICLCCGLFLTVILILCIVNNVNAFKVAPGIVFGVLYTIGSLFSLFFNHNAHLCVKDGSIKGNYHLWGKIDCNISSVSFTGAHPNTLTIQLKSGKPFLYKTDKHKQDKSSNSAFFHFGKWFHAYKCRRSLTVCDAGYIRPLPRRNNPAIRAGN